MLRNGMSSGLGEEADRYRNNTSNDVSPVYTKHSEDDKEDTKPTICFASIFSFVDPRSGNKNAPGDYMNQGIQSWDMHYRGKF